MTAQPITKITPTEVDGTHWVSINMDGREQLRGPFASAYEAEAAAARLAAVCRGIFHQPVSTPTRRSRHG